MQLTQTVKSTFKDAAKKLTGNHKRDFMAKVSEDYCGGSARKAETIFGWNRHSVQLGLQERRTGIICVDNYRARGCHKSEQRLPNLEADIRSLVDAKGQVWMSDDFEEPLEEFQDYSKPRPKFGSAKGLIKISDDFDE